MPGDRGAGDVGYPRRDQQRQARRPRLHRGHAAAPGLQGLPPLPRGAGRHHPRWQDGARGVRASRGRRQQVCCLALRCTPEQAAAAPVADADRQCGLGRGGLRQLRPAAEGRPPEWPPGVRRRGGPWGCPASGGRPLQRQLSQARPRLPRRGRAWDGAASRGWPCHWSVWCCLFWRFCFECCCCCGCCSCSCCCRGGCCSCSCCILQAVPQCRGGSSCCSRSCHRSLQAVPRFGGGYGCSGRSDRCSLQAVPRLGGAPSPGGGSPHSFQAIPRLAGSMARR
mmetsp:Transcript_20819/g.65876  ORF Transcript_20819/g.65876 Transcript_20819/m.65876 type:complete len:281 (+) Transcript_20819:930-1772(+)